MPFLEREAISPCEWIWQNELLGINPASILQKQVSEAMLVFKLRNSKLQGWSSSKPKWNITAHSWGYNPNAWTYKTWIYDAWMDLNGGHAAPSNLCLLSCCDMAIPRTCTNTHHPTKLLVVIWSRDLYYTQNPQNNIKEYQRLYWLYIKRYQTISKYSSVCKVWTRTRNKQIVRNSSLISMDWLRLAWPMATGETGQPLPQLFCGNAAVFIKNNQSFPNHPNLLGSINEGLSKFIQSCHGIMVFNFVVYQSRVRTRIHLLLTSEHQARQEFIQWPSGKPGFLQSTKSPFFLEAAGRIFRTPCIFVMFCW